MYARTREIVLICKCFHQRFCMPSSEFSTISLIFQNRFATSALFRIFAGNETFNFRSATLSI